MESKEKRYLSELLDIIPPEKGEPGYEEAKQKLKRLILNEKVEIIGIIQIITNQRKKKIKRNKEKNFLIILNKNKKKGIKKKETTIIIFGSNSIITYI